VQNISEAIKIGLELYQKGKERVTFDKLTVIGAITALAPSVLVPLQLACTAFVHEKLVDLPDESVRMLAIAIIGLATMASIATEIPALHRRGYSASITSSTLQVLTGKSLWRSSLVSVSTHVATGPMLVGMSPGNILAILTADLGRLGWENGAGVILGVTFWRMFFNTLIYFVDSKKLMEPAEKIHYTLNPDAYAPMRDVRKLE